MKRYINIKYNNQTETIDELDTIDFLTYKSFKKELRRLLNEYGIVMSYYVIYASQRACNEWRD